MKPSTYPSGRLALEMIATLAHHVMPLGALPRVVVAMLLIIGIAACDEALEDAVFEPTSSSAVHRADAPVGEARLGPGDARPETAARPMMIVFSRDYCAACRVMDPWVDALAQEVLPVDVVHVNVDRMVHAHLGRFFQVMAVPAIAFVDAGGAILERREGLTTKPQMLATMRRLGWVE